jgi:general secretion pathway protein I
MLSSTLPGKHHGFSLLEMVVAVAILALSLGALYRAAGGATRIVQVDERRTYAVELARSLLAVHAMVPLAGVSATGETDGGFTWRVVAEPVDQAQDSILPEGALQRITVAVDWPDGSRRREISLDSVVAGRETLE